MQRYGHYDGIAVFLANVCACVYVYLYVCVQLCICTFVCMYVSVRLCACVYLYVCVQVFVLLRSATYQN